MAVEHHNLVIKTALRSSGGSITLHNLRVICLASQLLHDAELLCDQEVHAPHVGTRHTSTSAEKDIQMMISNLLASQVTCWIPKRKLPCKRHFTTPENKGYEVALSKQWIAKCVSKTDLRIDDNQSTEDHEEIDSLDDTQL